MFRFRASYKWGLSNNRFEPELLKWDTSVIELQDPDKEVSFGSNLLDVVVERA